MDPSSPPKNPEDPSAASPEDATSTPTTSEPFKITIIFSAEHFSEPWTFTKPPVLDEIIAECQLTWPQYDWNKTKAIPGGNLGGGAGARNKKPSGFKKTLLKTPEDNELDLTPLNNLSLKLMAPKTADLSSLKAASAEAASIRAIRAQQRNTARLRAARINNNSRPGGPPRISGFGTSTTQGDSQYTFQTLRPLPHLPNPARSMAFLERLRDDPGIRAAMKKHKFSVGVLTEMDPRQYTQSDHQGTTRILGLNRNKGEVIELRLRTDMFDGYRDYKTIRNTLCHELAHNVHSNHDREFLDLMHLIQREVAAADYKSSGRTVGGEEYAPERDGGYEEEDDDMIVDHGGWMGGTFVLGGGDGKDVSRPEEAGLSMRDILARAAEQRLNKGKQKDEGSGGDGAERGSESGNGGGSAS